MIEGRNTTRSVSRGTWAGFLLAVTLLPAAGAPRAVAHADRWRYSLDKLEVYFPNADFQKLDTFEAHALGKADKAYNDGDYKQAHALYSVFALEFGKSRALPYALLRKGRCLHLRAKRFEAVKEYQEVLDYFPNAAAYAAAALYYQGLCHWQNADVKKAMVKWMEMAKDEDYSRHFLAAPAMNQLAAYLQEQGQADKAAEYYTKVVVNFRRSNPGAANHALGEAIRYHVRTNPSQPGLAELYQKAETFDAYRFRKVEGDPAKDRDYWAQVRHHVKANAAFKETEADLRAKYFAYWAGQMDGKSPDWDDFQIDLADFHRSADKDTARWCDRLDRQYAAFQKAGDHGRTVRWIAAYAAHKPKVKEYYGKLDFAKMAGGQVFDLMKIMYDDVRDADLGANVFGKFRFAEMPDKAKVEVARYLWRKDEELVKRACAAMGDRDLGKMELLRYYYWKEDARNGVPLAAEMEGVPAYAKEALWDKAQLLQWSRQYPQAIAAYQACDNPPENIWQIAACYVGLGKMDPAVTELSQIESFFRDRYGSQAALRIAHVYKHFRKDKEYVGKLRKILQQYPGSKESSQAHVELEKLGLKTGGGEDAKD